MKLTIFGQLVSTHVFVLAKSFVFFVLSFARASLPSLYLLASGAVAIAKK